MKAEDAKQIADAAINRLAPEIQNCYQAALELVKQKAQFGYHETKFEWRGASKGAILREVATLLRNIGYRVMSISADYGELTIYWD